MSLPGPERPQTSRLDGTGVDGKGHPTRQDSPKPDRIANDVLIYLWLRADPENLHQEIARGPIFAAMLRRLGLGLLLLLAFVPQVLAGGRAVYRGGYHWNSVLQSAPWHVYGTDGLLEGTWTGNAGGLATFQPGVSGLSVQPFQDEQIPEGAQITAINGYFALSRDAAAEHQEITPFTHYPSSGMAGGFCAVVSASGTPFISVAQVPVFPSFAWFWVPFSGTPADYTFHWTREELFMSGFGLWVLNPAYPNEGGVYWSEFVLLVDWR